MIDLNWRDEKNDQALLSAGGLLGSNSTLRKKQESQLPPFFVEILVYSQLCLRNVSVGGEYNMVCHGKMQPYERSV